MFDDFFVRLPCRRLQADADEMLRLDLAPEIAFNSQTLQELHRPERLALRRRLKDFRAHTLHAPFIDILPGSSDEDIRRAAYVKMRTVMDLATDWGSRLVVMHANYDPIYYRQQPDGWVARAADFFSRLLADGADGPRIAVENIADPTPDILLRLNAAVANPRLIHCFDFGHHHVFARIPFAEWLAQLQPCPALHFHLHDNTGSDDDHLPLGRGTIDWPRVRQVMAGLACPFTVALEPHSPENMLQSLDQYRIVFLARPLH